jgi:hypothetical protein
VKRREIAFTNDSSIAISIHFGGDPDISVMARLESENRKLVAIEIKGGTDVSNIWNRLGEAEKSHQTARKKGYNELWTITSVDLESPRTRSKPPNRNHPPRRVFSISRGLLMRPPRRVSFFVNCWARSLARNYSFRAGYQAF